MMTLKQHNNTTKVTSRHFLLLGKAERGVTPWTGLQSVTGLAQGDRQPLTLTSTLMGNLETSIKVTWIGLSLTCVKKNPTLVPRECWHANRKMKPKKQLSSSVMCYQ